MSGKEVDQGLEGFRRPRSYSLGSLDECLIAAAELNQNAESDVTDEGFVVVDGKHRRVKIKSPEYARALYEEYDHDRRAVASVIKDSSYAAGSH